MVIAPTYGEIGMIDSTDVLKQLKGEQK
jgi:hypothetical protein